MDDTNRMTKFFFIVFLASVAGLIPVYLHSKFLKSIGNEQSDQSNR